LRRTWYTVKSLASRFIIPPINLSSRVDGGLWVKSSPSKMTRTRSLLPIRAYGRPFLEYPVVISRLAIFYYFYLSPLQGVAG
jgi:hypothetical protein